MYSDEIFTRFLRQWIWNLKLLSIFPSFSYYFESFNELILFNSKMFTDPETLRWLSLHHIYCINLYYLKGFPFCLLKNLISVKKKIPNSWYCLIQKFLLPLKSHTDFFHHLMLHDLTLLKSITDFFKNFRVYEKDSLLILIFGYRTSPLPLCSSKWPNSRHHFPKCTLLRHSAIFFLPSPMNLKFETSLKFFSSFASVLEWSGNAAYQSI